MKENELFLDTITHKWWLFLLLGFALGLFTHSIIDSHVNSPIDVPEVATTEQKTTFDINNTSEVTTEVTTEATTAATTQATTAATTAATTQAVTEATTQATTAATTQAATEATTAAPASGGNYIPDPSQMPH